MVASIEAGSTAAVAGVAQVVSGTFEEGTELPGGGGLAFTLAGYGATGALIAGGYVRFLIGAYEY